MIRVVRRLLRPNIVRLQRDRDLHCRHRTRQLATELKAVTRQRMCLKYRKAARDKFTVLESRVSTK